MDVAKLTLEIAVRKQSFGSEAAYALQVAQLGEIFPRQKRIAEVSNVGFVVNENIARTKSGN